MNRIPTAEDFQRSRVTNPNQSEVVRQRLYDFQLYPAAGVSQFSFFSQPQGQGVTTATGGVVGSPKTLWDTNQEMPNTLPSGKAFMVESIEVVFLPGASSVANTFTPAPANLFNAVAAASVDYSANDVNNVYSSGMLEFNILSKNYLRETPLMAFPPKTYVGADFAVASNSATTGVSALSLTRASGRPYYVEPTISLQPAVNFEVLIKFPAAVALVSSFNGRIGVILDGYMMRASQ